MTGIGARLRDSARGLALDSYYFPTAKLQVEAADLLDKQDERTETLTEALRTAKLALLPVNACVFNDNGDITVSGAINYDHYVRAHFALKIVKNVLASVGEDNDV